MSLHEVLSKAHNLTLMFFGYGSLMYPEGINGRGIKHNYNWGDLIPARVYGVTRGLYAEIGPNSEFITMYKSPFNRDDIPGLFYGIRKTEDPNSFVNGVLFPIHTIMDLYALLKDELSSRSYGLYEPVFLTAQKSNGKSTTCVSLMSKGSVSSGALPWPGYIEHVFEGIQPWGKKFVDEFLLTGGLNA